MIQTTVAQFKSAASSKLHGANLNIVTGVNEKIYEAGQRLMLRIDPVTTRRKALLANALYDRVYDYQAPSDMKMNKVIDIRPQAGRRSDDYTDNTGSLQFDTNKHIKSNEFTVEDFNGTRIIRLNKEGGENATLHTMDSLTANGTWADDGQTNTTNLILDTFDYMAGAGAISFEMLGGQTSAGIVNSNRSILHRSLTLTTRSVNMLGTRVTICGYDAFFRLHLTHSLFLVMKIKATTYGEWSAKLLVIRLNMALRTQTSLVADRLTGHNMILL